MNIAIDLGTSFTYVGTWIDNRFIPLILGDTEAVRFGYPTTFYTVPIVGEISDYQSEIMDNSKSVRIECFTGRGITSIKQNILSAFRERPNFEFTNSFAPINRGTYWANHSNGVKGTPDIVFRALFEVLLKLTFKAVEQNTDIVDKKLNKIILCFPDIEKGTDYKTCLRDSFFSACAKVKWARNVKQDDIIIESENRCVPAIVSEKFLDKKILFIDIGGATSDYCIKSPGTVSTINPNIAQSRMVGTTSIDDNLLTEYVTNESAIDFVDSIMLTKVKANIEELGNYDIIIKDDHGRQLCNEQISRSEYDKLQVWEDEFKPFFESLLSLANNQPQVDLVILSCGGSKISNIKKQAQAVFTCIDVKTIEEVAAEIEMGDVTANNGVCYGATKFVDLVVRAEGHGSDAEKAQKLLDEMQKTTGIGTLNYDIRYCYLRDYRNGYHLFMKPGISLAKPIYSECERLTYIGSNEEVWKIRVNKLKEAKTNSDKEFLYENEDATDDDFKNLILRDHDSGVRISYGTQEDVGVIACQGKSSIYFLVVTYAGQQISSNGKTYNIGEKINETYFAENALPSELIHAPNTKAAYDYAKDNGIHPDSADSAYAKHVGVKKKKSVVTPNSQSNQEPTITNQDKDTARENLEKKYSQYNESIKKLRYWRRRKKLKTAYDSYRDQIGKCDDKSKLDGLLDKADNEFSKICNK